LGNFDFIPLIEVFVWTGYGIHTTTDVIMERQSGQKMSLIYDSASSLADQIASEILEYSNESSENIVYEQLEEYGYLKLQSNRKILVDLANLSDYPFSSLLIRIRNIKTVVNKLLSRTEVKALSTKRKADMDPIEMSHRLLSLKALFRDSLQLEDKDLPRYQLFLPKLPSDNRTQNCQSYHQDSSFVYNSCLFESDRSSVDIDYCDWVMTMNCQMTKQLRDETGSNERKHNNEYISWKSQTLRRLYLKENKSVAKECSGTVDSLQVLLEQLPSNNTDNNTTTITASLNELINDVYSTENDGKVEQSYTNANNDAIHKKDFRDNLDNLLSSLDEL